jgi:hypothetical protein
VLVASKSSSKDEPALPAFAEGYPRDPELDRLVAYFARGNHRKVRDEAEALAKRTEDPAVAAAARDLRGRLEPDRLAWVILGATGLLLVTLTGWAIRKSHQHPPPPAPVRTVQTVSK